MLKEALGFEHVAFLLDALRGIEQRAHRLYPHGLQLWEKRACVTRNKVEKLDEVRRREQRRAELAPEPRPIVPLADLVHSGDEWVGGSRASGGGGGARHGRERRWVGCERRSRPANGGGLET